MFGIRLNTTAYDSDIEGGNRVVGYVYREIAPGAFPARARVNPDKLYRIRFNLSSDQSTDQQAQIRLRARTVKFGYFQSLVIGGAWATNTDPLVGNAAIAIQSLPGVGTLNPDRRPSQTNGGWYDLILNSPLSEDIRSDEPGSIADRFPILSAQPGFGANANSRRDIKVGIELFDSLSFGARSGEELGDVTLDAVEIYEYDQIPD